MKYLENLFYYTVVIVAGLSIPIFFTYLDMWELQIDPTFSNMVDMLKSQNIYQFSIVFFPGMFTVVTILIQQIRIKSKQVQEEFEYLKVLLNATPDAILFLNEEREIIFQNNQFKLLFSDVNAILEESSVYDFLNQVEYIQKEVNVHSHISKSHPFLMSFKLTKFKNRKNYFISFKDLKSLKDKEKIIEDQKHQMIEKNKLASLGEMAAGIAHEINNPLTVINSNNTMLTKLIDKNKLEANRVEKLIVKTKDQIKRITTIITTLRNLSRGLANDEMESFSLDQVVKESIILAKIRDKTNTIVYKFNETQAVVFGHRGQIIQVIINLLNNAIDAINTEQSPWIKIEINQKGDDKVELFITDSGNGIPSDVAEKIFLPMYTTKDIGKGTGLGLSLSRNFMTQNHGTLEYILKDGHTSFKLSLNSKARQEVLTADETDQKAA